MNIDSVLSSYAPAWVLEQALGDPLLDANPLSFHSATQADASEQFPEASLRVLKAVGLQRHYVPRALGGECHSYEALLWLLRAVGRRDFTAAVAHAVSVPPALLVWCAGSEEQQRTVRDIVLRGEHLAIAFHEKAHGNDFMATDVVADRVEQGYELRGEKWGVTGVRRSKAVVLLARTAKEGGPRGFSLLLVETAEEKASLSYLDKFKTHGVRGLDIDGLRLVQHVVPTAAVLGGVGGGFELSLKCSQVSRTLSLGPLLGAMDTALRATAAHHGERRLYGEPAASIPAVRASLAGAFCDLLLMECATLASTRAMHFAPGRLSVWAAATKAFVTVSAERTLQELSVLMGSRFYFRDVWWHGIFEKIVRDAPMTRVSHFGGVISLVHLAAALPSVYRRSVDQAPSGALPELLPLFQLSGPLPPAELDKLRLVAHGADPLFAGLEFVDQQLTDETLVASLNPVLVSAIRSEIRLLLVEVEATRSFLAALPELRGPDFGRSPELLEVARRHASFFAATSAALFWINNLNQLDNFGRQGDWLYLGLRRLREQFRPALGLLPAASLQRVSDRVFELLSSDRWFSLLAPKLAMRGAQATPESARL